MRSILLVVVIGSFLGCAADASGPCSSAAEHIAACTGETPAAASETCDVERADAVLEMDCDQLIAASAAGKADGWWESFMCGLGVKSYCSGGGSGSGSGSGSQSTAKTLSGNLYKIGTTEGLNGFTIRLAPSTGTDVKTVQTFSGTFLIGGLKPERYTLEVRRYPGSGVLVTQSVDMTTQRHVTLFAPAL